jgi:hypothetical protein
MPFQHAGEVLFVYTLLHTRHEGTADCTQVYARDLNGKQRRSVLMVVDTSMIYCKIHKYQV